MYKILDEIRKLLDEMLKRISKIETELDNFSHKLK